MRRSNNAARTHPAHALTRDHTVDVIATYQKALTCSSDLFYFDSADLAADHASAAHVEGNETRQAASTVYTDVGAFTVPDDFEVVLAGRSRE